jgi:hypothetical protein
MEILSMLQSLYQTHYFHIGYLIPRNLELMKKNYSLEIEKITIK